MSGLLEGLNSVQREACRYDGDKHLLILAGAGSGKTRVISHRIAYLIESLGLMGWQILGFSFTNKSARELRERTLGLLGDSSKAVGLNLSTFHSFGARFLRLNGAVIGLDSDFSIYDEGEQGSVLKEIFRDLGRDKVDASEIRQMVQKISRAKDAGETIESITESARNREGELFAHVFRRYEEALRKLNAVDFADLIVKTTQILRENAVLRQEVHRRYRCILVDEFQDTNGSQLEMLQMLRGNDTQLCVVGDDDQSIYAWRGSCSDYLLKFESIFGEAKIYKLEQNYRSTKKILAVSSMLIAHNVVRYEKVLWTDGDEGEDVQYKSLESDLDEGDWVVGEIRKLLKDGVSASEIAVLYRTNGQSRVFEEKLGRAQIGYQVVGGVGFFERSEVKDLMCYLRVLVNGRDLMALRRILNVPRRGVGEVAMEKLCSVLSERYQVDRDSREVMREVMQEVVDGKLKIGNVNARKGVGAFLDILVEAEQLKDECPSFILDMVIRRSSYMDYLMEKDKERFRETEMNVEALMNSLRDFESESEDPSLSSFVEQMALVRPESDESEASVKLMSIHSAKGLEFEAVFVCGLEEDLLPFRRDMEMDLEEERRLAYVAFTRAKRRLFLSRAAIRSRYHSVQLTRPSRFLKEIGIVESIESGPRYVDEDGGYWHRSSDRGQLRKSSSRRSRGDEHYFESMPDYEQESQIPYYELCEGGFQIGESVGHERYGRGRVVSVRGVGDSAVVKVDFGLRGMKTIVGKFLKRQ